MKVSNHNPGRSLAVALALPFVLAGGPAAGGETSREFGVYEFHDELAGQIKIALGLP